MPINERDLDTLARTLFGEAEANNIDDAVAIANVVMNRVSLPNWPDNAAAVCLQPWQFSCWNPNDPGRKRIASASGPWFEKCKEIAEQALSFRLRDTTIRSTHYYATFVKTPKWAKKKKAVFAVPHRSGGAHLFFNNIDTPAPTTAKQALDQQQPLSETKTVKGSAATAIGLGGAEAVDPLTQATSSLQVLAPYSDYIKYAFLALAVAGIIYTLYGRWKQRKDGQA